STGGTTARRPRPMAWSRRPSLLASSTRPPRRACPSLSSRPRSKVGSLLLELTRQQLSLQHWNGHVRAPAGLPTRTCAPSSTDELPHAVVPTCPVLGPGASVERTTPAPTAPRCSAHNTRSERRGAQFVGEAPKVCG